MRCSTIGTPLPLVEAAQTPLESVLGALLNELSALASELVLVLDDYHLVEDRQVHEQVASFLDRLPPNVHVVITSRADPPLPLARLRARGELVEIRAADLRFTPDEAAAYLNDVMCQIWRQTSSASWKGGPRLDRGTPVGGALDAGPP
jgi:LuxR family transcriptional regulator, maltose regulon positive regulatory protein